MHVGKRHIEHFPTGNEDEVGAWANGAEHRRNAGAKPSFGAVALHAVPHLFGNGETDLDAIGAIPCPDQRKQMRTYGFSDTVGVTKFLMSFQRIGSIHRFLFRIQQLRQANRLPQALIQFVVFRLLWKALCAQLLTTLGASALQNVAAVGSRHTLAETMNLAALSFLGLIGTYHIIRPSLHE